MGKHPTHNAKRNADTSSNPFRFSTPTLANARSLREGEGGKEARKESKGTEKYTRPPHRSDDVTQANLLVVEKADLQIAVRCDPQPVAGTAEVLCHGCDETDTPFVSV